MLYRIKQVINIIYPNIKKTDIDMAVRYLEAMEIRYFESMSDYDKRHSINVLKNVLRNDLLKNDKLYLRLSLLHDCGKKKDTTFFQRFYHALTKKGSLQFHPKRGFELIKGTDYKLALLILKHHNKNIQNKKLAEFQKIDSKN